MLSRVLRQVRRYPPQTLWYKTRRRLRRTLRIHSERWVARWASPVVNDAQLLRAVGGRFPTIPAFLSHMATRTTPVFFITPADKAERVAAIRRWAPACEATTIAAADTACAHIFDLLGSGPVALGPIIDWHTDFKSGHRWNPHTYFADIRAAPPPGGYDLKLPWELSRCQHFAWMGQAYWFSDDERYAAEFVAQVTDWIAHNPPRLGVNWACAMDVAIRAVNWLWGYAFFQASPALTAAFRLAFWKSLLQHGRHIFANLEYSETLTSNHYLSDVVGLVYLGIMMPEFAEAQQWRSFGLTALEQEMFKQVYPDGADFEASISYHRLVAELFLSATLLAQRNGYSFSDAYLERLEKMADFTQAVTRPDGAVPLIGDCDNGRLHRLKAWGGDLREWCDHRHLLATSAALFDRPDFAHSAGDQWEEAIWLTGATACAWAAQADETHPPAPPLGSRRFPDAGVHILRSDQTYIIVDAGGNGQNGNGGHAHNDALSFEWFAAGRTLVTDPGTGLYTADYARRNRYRSTRAHNSILVDGEELCRIDPDRLFTLEDDLQPRVLHWSVRDESTLLVAEHDGYRRLIHPVVHRRLWRLDHATGDLLTGDLVYGVGVQGAGHHSLELNIQLPAPDTAIEIGAAATVARWGGGGFVIRPLDALGWTIAQVTGEVSPSYGVCYRAPKLVYAWQGVLPARLLLCWRAFDGPAEPDAISRFADPTKLLTECASWMSDERMSKLW